jgi:hypothetical protein
MPDIWITERCTDCGHKWRFKAFSADKSGDDVPVQECPKCEKVQVDIGMDVAAGKAPGIGGNPAVRAMDISMEITAEQYGLTNLETDGRVGATMAPKLPAQQQAAADGMFDAKARGKVQGFARNPILARARMMAGALQAGKDPNAVVAGPTRPQTPAVNAIESIHRAQYRMPVTILNQKPDGTVIR